MSEMSPRRRRIAESPEDLEEQILARVRVAAIAAADKKAFMIDVLKVAELTSIADYFLICSTSSERQAMAVCEAIEERLRDTLGVRPSLIEGKSSGRWILLDYGDFVVHVFLEESRKFYRLERLWGDAPNLARELLGDLDRSAF